MIGVCVCVSVGEKGKFTNTAVSRCQEEAKVTWFRSRQMRVFLDQTVAVLEFVMVLNPFPMRPDPTLFHRLALLSALLLFPPDSTMDQRVMSV